MRKKKNILSEEQGDDTLPLLEPGASRPRAVEGEYFPLQSLLYLSRNEKLSRNKCINLLLFCVLEVFLATYDIRDCPEVFLDLELLPHEKFSRTFCFIHTKTYYHFTPFNGKFWSQIHSAVWSVSSKELDFFVHSLYGHQSPFQMKSTVKK